MSGGLARAISHRRGQAESRGVELGLELSWLPAALAVVGVFSQVMLMESRIATLDSRPTAHMSA